MALNFEDKSSKPKGERGNLVFQCKGHSRLCCVHYENNWAHCSSKRIQPLTSQRHAHYLQYWLLVASPLPHAWVCSTPSRCYCRICNNCRQCTCSSILHSQCLPHRHSSFVFNFTYRTCNTNTHVKVCWWPQRNKRQNKDDCTKLELDNNDLFHSTQIWPTVEVVKHVASLPSPPHNSRQCEEGLCDFGSDFVQMTSDHKEDACFGVNPSQVSDFNITLPTTHHWCLSIDAHQMHVALVTFWSFGIWDEFANRQKTSIPKLELRSPFYLLFNFFTPCFFTRLGS